jgi:hypothetical protein
VAVDALAVAIALRAGRAGSGGRVGGGGGGGARRRWAWLAVAGVVAMLIAADVHAALHQAAYDVHGPLQPTPDWGESAFSANGTVELRAQ